ncbi:MAG: hypothetical protein LBP24_02455 [Coriobacteriales bacterium]|nr:hypothetical protein [Coriobacteriales bacterium]
MKNRQPMSRTRKNVLVAACCTALALVPCIAVICINVFALIPASIMPITMGGPWVNRQIEVTELESYHPPTRWFDTADEAIRDDVHRSEGSFTLLSDEMFRFEDNDAATCFYIEKAQRGRPYLAAYCLDKRQGRFSNPVFSRGTPLHPSDRLNGLGFHFSEIDYIASYINDSITAYDVYSRANSGQWTAVGITQDPGVYNMRILGEAPSDIYSFEFDGATYYAWCYKGIDMRKALLGDTTGNGAEFTLADIAQRLDIRFE